MKIDSSAVQMSASSTQVKSMSVSEKFVLQFDKPAEEAEAAGRANQNNRAAILALSPEAQGHTHTSNKNELARLKDIRSPFKAELELPDIPDKYKMKAMLIEQLLGKLNGKDNKPHGVNHPKQHPHPGHPQNTPQMPQQPMFVLRQAQPVANFDFQRTESYYESQQMSFQATGLVNTSDGRQIQFDLNVFASYEFMSSTSVEMAGQLLADPLIINFDGTLPEFTDERYAFDLILGGDIENIFMPTNGSGFLALDKDDNGTIDNGSELFGATTGNGFYELSLHDQDGNGWIDENDEVFDLLKVMFIDKNSGEATLMSLKEAGVGAIYLGSTSTGGYEIKAEGNELVGVVQRSGIFLSENGKAGSIHHVDLTY